MPDVPIVPSSPVPRHLDERWRYLALRPAAEDQPRRPLLRHPGPGDEHHTDTRGLSWERYLQVATGYWEGYEQTWEQLPDFARHGYHVGLLPERSDLVVLDCDVVTVDEITGWRVHDGHATLEVRREYGTDDLLALCRELGRDPAELGTYAVRTKSGGHHLYFRANPRWPQRTRHHREGWRVDVVAGKNSWVVAPPTPGYAVERDRPVLVLPDWLGEWLGRLPEHRPPLGGEARRKLDVASAKAWRELAKVPTSREEWAGSWRDWVRLELKTVSLANQVGGWNQAINDAAYRLLWVGYPRETVERLVLEAAAPVNELEKRRARDTINSAERGAARALASDFPRRGE